MVDILFVGLGLAGYAGFLYAIHVLDERALDRRR